MEKVLCATAILASFAFAVTTSGRSQEDTPDTDDKELAADLELMQGKWELVHGRIGNGAPTTRSVKTIKGNKETVNRYNVKKGTLQWQHSVEFKLSKSGSVRVFTFYAVGGSPENGSSYVYKIDKDNFYDVPGLLDGPEYQNYQKVGTIWHWKRITEEEAEAPVESP